MSTDFSPILAALRKLKSSGAGGFEGLVRDTLEIVCCQRLYLVKSGPQKGKDILGERRDGLPRIAIEAKKFKAKTDLALDEMKEKLGEAIEADDIDVWGVALSKEMVEPDWSEVAASASKAGVTPISLDWKSAPGTLPVLAALVAAGFEVVGPRIPSVPATLIAAVKSHPQYEDVIEEVRSKLADPRSGFAPARHCALDWLEASLRSATLARQRLRGLVNVAADDIVFVQRQEPNLKLDAWWRSDSPLAVVLGLEGRGKTWVAMDWALKVARSFDAMVLVVSARDVADQSPETILAAAIGAAVGRDAKGMADRVRRWASGGGRFLLVIDGLNEHWSVDWQEVFARFRFAPWAGSVKVLATARRQFWRSAFKPVPGEMEADEVAVGDYDDREFAEWLASAGTTLRRDDISRSLSALMRVPRMAALALSVEASLQGRAVIGTADLILADWKSRVQRNHHIEVDEKGLSDFVRDIARQASGQEQFRISSREVYELLSKDSGKPIEHYRAAIDELVEGSWLVGTDRKDRYEMNERMLPHAIGMEVASRLGTAKSAEEAREIIAPYVEQLRGADEAASILRAACAFLVTLGEASRQVMEAVIEEWLGEQNFGPEDFRQLWPLAVREPDLFLDLSERAFVGPLRSIGETEILVKSLANAAAIEAVRERLETRLPRWVGAYSTMRTDATSDGKKAADRSASMLEEWNAVEPAELDLGACLRPDATDHLSDAAISILSYLPRAPFIKAIAVRALSAVLDADWRSLDSFEWMLRLNEEDPEEAADAIQRMVVLLRSIGHTVADTVASVLEEASGLPGTERKAAPEFPAARTFGAARVMEPDGRIVPGPTADGLSADDPIALSSSLVEYAVRPDAVLCSADIASVRSAVEMLLADVELFVSAFERDPELVRTFARWAPGALAELADRHWKAIVAHDFGALRKGFPLDVEDFYLLLDPTLSGELRLHAVALDPVIGPEHTRTRADREKLATIAAAMAPEDQLSLIEQFAEAPGFERDLSRLLRSPSSADAARIVATKPKSTVAAWLSYLHLVLDKDVVVDEDRLLGLAQDDAAAVRAAAIGLLCDFGSDRLRSAFASSGWSHTIEMERAESIYGSFILMRRLDMEMESLVDRISPGLVGQATQIRGLRPEDAAVAARKMLDSIHSALNDPGPRKIEPAEPLPSEAARAMVIAEPKLLEKVREALEADKAVGFMHERPIPELVAAAIAVDPVSGSELLLTASEANAGMGFIDVALEVLRFTATDRTEFEALRIAGLTKVKKDEEIMVRVRRCQSNGHEQWLASFVLEQFEGASAGRMALALTIAGCLDGTAGAEAMWEKLNRRDLRGWLEDVRRWARRRYRRNGMAKHWFERFLAADTDTLAFDDLVLFDALIDERCHDWSGRMIRASIIPVDHPRRRFLAATDRRRKSARKDRDKAMSDTLYGTRRHGTVWPWY